jgi:hypothetical protein
MSYIALATTTLGSGASSVTFSSIPTSVNGVALRDLILVINGKVGANSNMIFYYNSDQSNGTSVWMQGNGSSASSSSIGFMFAGTWNANQDSNAIIQIMDYAQTDKHKTALVRGNQAADTGAWALANRWASTSAITSVIIDPTGGNTLSAGTTLSLYGVAA